MAAILLWTLTIPKEIKKKGRIKFTKPMEAYIFQCSPKASILIPFIQQYKTITSAAKKIRPNAIAIGVYVSEAILILKNALPQIAAKTISKKKSFREALCINQG